MSIKSQIAVLLLSIAGVLSCSSKPDYGPNSRYHSTRFPQTRTASEAKVWLHWSKSERVAFMRGLVIGYRPGRRVASSDAEVLEIAERAHERDNVSSESHASIAEDND